MESGSGFEVHYKLVYGNKMSFLNWQDIVLFNMLQTLQKLWLV